MQDKIDNLIKQYGDNDQRTDAWHTKRSNMLTASEISKAKADASASAKRELIMSKLVPKVHTSSGSAPSLEWGTQFEEPAKEIFQKENLIEIKDLSCVVHPEHSFLGASPDGLLLCSGERHGRLIEIKCPISREIDITGPIPDAYYDQIQLQLACTDLEECEYVEFKFVKQSYAEWMESTAKWKSCFAVNNITRKVTYKDIDDNCSIQDWQLSFMQDRFDWDVIYWSLKTKKEMLIKKDQEWFSDNLASFKNVWEDILKYRETETFPPPVKNTMILDL
jgi:putative phage-type endonuclease